MVELVLVLIAKDDGGRLFVDWHAKQTDINGLHLSDQACSLVASVAEAF